MTNKNDPLSDPVSVEVILTKHGFKGEFKSRAISALDRLLGNVIDLPNAWFEHKSTKKRAATDVEVQAIHTAGDILLQEIHEDRELAKKIIRDISSKGERAIKNKTAIAEETLEQLKLQGIPKEAASNKEDTTPEEIDEDWMNGFEAYAERASSTSKQQLWARVLAGQICNPDSFSLQTLRILSELEASAAESFENIVSCRIHKGWITKPKKLENDLLRQYLSLEQKGLLTNVDGSLQTNLNFNQIEGFLALTNGDVIGIFTPKPQITNALLNVIPLTQAGLEICQLIPVNHLSCLRCIAEQIKGQVESATAHKLTGKAEGNNIAYETKPFADLLA